jgi:hypothetical protein
MWVNWYPNLSGAVGEGGDRETNGGHGLRAGAAGAGAAPPDGD